jgi:hypothetical protein
MACKTAPLSQPKRSVRLYAALTLYVRSGSGFLAAARVLGVGTGLSQLKDVLAERNGYLLQTPHEMILFHPGLLWITMTPLGLVIGA